MLSQQLESLHLLAVVSDDLFDVSSSTTHWPKLRNLHIDFDVVTPNGTWMFEEDPEDLGNGVIDPDEDSDYQEMRVLDDRRDHEMPARFDWPRRYFRSAPNRYAYDRVHLAMAKAIPRMPNLRKLRFSADQGTAGCVCTYIYDGREIHKVLWKSYSTTTYEPNSELIAEWKRAVAHRSGQLEIQVVGIDDPASDLVSGTSWPRF